MPAKMHSWYFRNFHMKNLLCKPEGVSIAGTPIDLTKIKTPACFISEAWAEKAKQNKGSWWPEWQKWVKPGGGKAVAARQPGDGDLDVIEAAPGSYAKLRL